MKKKKTEIAGTKEKIAVAFKELVCRKAFSKITITDIANSCDMTRENFYYHFRDKYDIVCWIFDREIKDKLDQIQGEFPQWFFMFLHYINQDYNYYRKVFKVIDMTMLDRQMHQLFAEKIPMVLENNFLLEPGFHKDDKKEKFIVDFGAQSFVHWIVEYVVSHESMEEEVVMDDFQYLFSRVLSAVRKSEEITENAKKS